MTTQSVTLFCCGSLSIFADGDRYRSATGEVFTLTYDYDNNEDCLLAFLPGSDIPIIDGEPLDALLQCLEHRLASRNLADPMFERTNALEHLRRMRKWLAALK